MPTWRISLYAALTGLGAAFLTYNGVYEYLLSQIDPQSHDGQAGMGAWFGALYATPVAGFVVMAIVWIVLWKVTRKNKGSLGSATLRSE
jgi:hypothetical protein